MKKIDTRRGSITLEAAIVVPIFIILMLFVNGIFIMFMGQQIMTHTLIQSAKSLAFDPYASQRVTANEEDKEADLFVDMFSFTGGNHISTNKWYEVDEDLAKTIKNRYIAYLRPDRTNARALLKMIGVKDGIKGLDFSESSIVDGMLTIKLIYKQDFIFNAAGVASFDRNISVKVRLFEYKEWFVVRYLLNVKWRK